MIEYQPIPGFPGYNVTADGTVFSIRRGQRAYLASRLHKGYYHVQIRSGSGRVTQKKIPVHTCVLLAFKGPKPFAGAMCRHLNGNALDNRLINLAWGTSKENYQDQLLHGTQGVGEQHHASKLTSVQVLDIRARVIAGESQKNIAAAYGINQRHVSDIKHARTWRALLAPQGG